MSFGLNDADLSFDSDDSLSSYMDAEMEPEQQNQQTPLGQNLLDSLTALHDVR